MFNVCIMGASLTTGNMGVSALAASLFKLVLIYRPDASITLFTSGRTPQSQEIKLLGKRISIKVANYRLSPKSSIGEHLFVILLLAFFYKMIPIQAIKDTIVRYNRRLNVIANADFVGDIRGGDSFSDIYGVMNFIIGSMPSIITLFMRKKLVLLPQTYGPYDSKIAQVIAAFILKHAYVVLSRDREGIDVVKKILKKNDNGKQVIFCPDVAFALDSFVPKNSDFCPFAKTETDPPIIGLNINGLLYNGGYTRDNMFKLKFDYKLFVHQLSKCIVEKTNANLLLVPHTFAPGGHVESDPDACAEVLKIHSGSYRDRIHMIRGEYDQHAIKGIIGFCDFFIGSRMHACIAALSQGIPTVGIAYSRKFKGVFDAIEVGQMVIDARVTDADETIKKILFMYENREQMETALKSRVKIAKDQLLYTFQKLLHPH